MASGLCQQLHSLCLLKTYVYIFCPGILPSLSFKGVSGHYIGNSVLMLRFSYFPQGDSGFGHGMRRFHIFCVQTVAIHSKLYSSVTFLKKLIALPLKEGLI